MSRSTSTTVGDRPVRIDFRNRHADSAIVLIHGFGGDAKETWGDFPRFLIERVELTGWDIFGVGYASNLRIDFAGAWTADARLETLGYYLRTALGLPPLGRYRNIAVIAHSMGGLIAQQALLDERCRSRVSHLIMFGTPSAGVRRASFVQSLNRQAQDMMTGSDFVNGLRGAWPDAYADGRFFVRAVAGERDAIVPTSSSLDPFAENMRFVVPGDHVTMVKPKDAQSASVELVVQALVEERLRAGSPGRHNLPRHLSRFIGRGKEIDEILDLLETHQLVTMIGPGGIGKTRTALRVAERRLHCAPDGAWFVDLAPLSDPALVPSAIAAVFNIEDRGSSQDLINIVALTLKEKSALVILDNCEHVLAAAAEAADHILRSCPDVRMIVTTRETMRIAGESTYRMPVLSESEGVTLFAERAKAADSSFELDDTNRAVVEEIVQRLDGIALAIELAAPRVKVMGVDQLAKRLDQRLKLLAGGSRTAPMRQQTLRALIGWSYDLLDAAERTMLRQLGVFRGGFALDAVTEVCEAAVGTEQEWDVLGLLSSLVEKSLVVVDAAGDLRYRLLESTRDFALEHLREAGELDRLAQRHCRCFIEMAERAYEAVWGTNLQEWLTQTRSDLENYRAAIHWGLIEGRDALGGASIVANLLYIWDELLAHEGKRLAERAMAATTNLEPGRLLGRTLLLEASLGGHDAPVLDACDRAVSILQTAGDDVSRADALRIYGRNLIRAGNVDESLRRMEEAIALSRSLGLPRLTARILGYLGYVRYVRSGDARSAIRALEEAASTQRGLGDRRRLAGALNNLAEVRFANADVFGAIADVSEVLAIYSETSGAHSEPWILISANLAAYKLGANDLVGAWEVAREAFQAALDLNENRLTGFALQHLAHVAALTGDLERAARLTGFVDAAFAVAGLVREPTENVGYESIMKILRDGLGEERTASLLAEGAEREKALIVAEALGIPRPEPALRSV